MSTHSKERLEIHLEKINIDFPIVNGIAVEKINTLGLYIFNPRSEQETDYSYAEYAAFVINAEGNIQIINISNMPFATPELEALANGLNFIREKSTLSVLRIN